MEKQVLRASLHEREGGHCFYCLRRSPGDRKCLDHVVPQAQGGGNSYRNLVSCCVDCNSQKGEQSAAEYLRWLFRGRRLSDAELGGRLRAMDDLAAGKLRPPLESQGNIGGKGSKGEAGIRIRQSAPPQGPRKGVFGIKGRPPAVVVKGLSESL